MSALQTSRSSSRGQLLRPGARRDGGGHQGSTLTAKQGVFWRRWLRLLIGLLLLHWTCYTALHWVKSEAALRPLEQRLLADWEGRGALVRYGHGDPGPTAAGPAAHRAPAKWLRALAERLRGPLVPPKGATAAHRQEQKGGPLQGRRASGGPGGAGPEATLLPAGGPDGGQGSLANTSDCSNPCRPDGDGWEDEAEDGAGGPVDVAGGSQGLWLTELKLYREKQKELLAELANMTASGFKLDADMSQAEPAQRQAQAANETKWFELKMHGRMWAARENTLVTRMQTDTFETPPVALPPLNRTALRARAAYLYKPRRAAHRSFEAPCRAGTKGALSAHGKHRIHPT